MKPDALLTDVYTLARSDVLTTVVAVTEDVS